MHGGTQKNVQCQADLVFFFSMKAQRMFKSSVEASFHAMHLMSFNVLPSPFRTQSRLDPSSILAQICPVKASVLYISVNYYEDIDCEKFRLGLLYVKTIYTFLSFTLRSPGFHFISDNRIG